jgi:hypothetical protein
MKTITRFIYAALASVVLATGALTAYGAPGNLFASINGIYENGAGSIYQYRANGLHRIFASNLSQPRGVAFDHFGNLFVTNNTCDVTCQITIVKITPDGVQSTFATLSGDLYGEDVAFDRARNLFVMAQDDTSPTFASTIYKFTPTGYRARLARCPAQVSASPFTGRAISLQRTRRLIKPSIRLRLTARRARLSVQQHSILSIFRSVWLLIASATSLCHCTAVTRLVATTGSLNLRRTEWEATFQRRFVRLAAWRLIEAEISLLPSEAGRHPAIS